MNKPQFITFTGADDYTDINAMRALEADYPVEFGILHSVAREGMPRYPTRTKIEKFNSAGLRQLSAHICGDGAKIISTYGDHDELDMTAYTRAQINLRAQDVNTFKIMVWADAWDIRPIVQCRSADAFPDDHRVDWVYDPSGGRGTSQAVWPRHPGMGILVGYAGGLGPGSDWMAISEASRGEPYWIDMETRIRNDQDQFDLGLCRKVCEEVYGPTLL